MTYEPTEAEVDELVDKMTQASRDDLVGITIAAQARYILRHYEPRSNDQRCDGSGRVRYRSGRYCGDVSCPGCSHCKSPGRANDGGLAASESTTERDARTATAAAPVAPVESVVYVDPDSGLTRMKPHPTVFRLAEDQFRALVAVLLTGSNWADAGTACCTADTIIAAAKEKE